MGFEINDIQAVTYERTQKKPRRPRSQEIVLRPGDKYVLTVQISGDSSDDPSKLEEEAPKLTEQLRALMEARYQEALGPGAIARLFQFFCRFFPSRQSRSSKELTKNGRSAKVDGLTSKRSLSRREEGPETPFPGDRPVADSHDATEPGQQLAVETRARAYEVAERSRSKTYIRHDQPAVQTVQKKTGMQESRRFEWKPDLDYYHEKRAIRFSSQQDYACAAEMLWTELRDLPHDVVGDLTIIVPAEAVELFASKKLKFEESPVLSTSEVPADQLMRLRKEQGPCTSKAAT